MRAVHNAKDSPVIRKWAWHEGRGAVQRPAPPLLAGATASSLGAVGFLAGGCFLGSESREKLFLVSTPYMMD